MSHVSQINVFEEAGRQSFAELGSILENLLPVKFAFTKDVGYRGIGELNIGDVAERSNRNGGPVLSGFTIPHIDEAAVGDELIELTVKFADDADVPFPFRARTVSAKVAAGAKTLALSGNEKTLAKTEHGPVWVVGEKQGVKYFRSGLPLPRIPAGGGFQDVFKSDRFLELLPLIQWLREICPGVYFEGPKPRACYIFDDPNLHWPTYGHVNFQKIAEQAVRENYHMSFATVPLDSWYTNEATAELFRSHAGQLSLSVHGNDHVKCELARDYTDAERASLLRQAIQRIEKLERRTGLQVSRVMVPPHGACSEAMLGELPRRGYESACISHGSLRAHNPGKPWTRMLGYHPSELIQNCPVMPRWSISGPTGNTMLLAAYLRQPLVLRGHHQDLKQGIEVLGENARFINRLGPVSWGNLTELSRMNYQWRIDGNVCRVRPLSRKISVEIPPGATSLVVESHGSGSWRTCLISGDDGSKVKAQVGEPTALSEAFSGIVSIETVHTMPGEEPNHRRTSPLGAVIRRLATEGRDRLLA